MYKRKFSKTNTIVDKVSSQFSKSSASTLENGPPKSIVSAVSDTNISDDVESFESPPMLENINDFPIEKKRKTVNSDAGDTTDYSEPLFDDNNDTFSFLKQTLDSCGLHLKCDQHILCE